MTPEELFAFLARHELAVEATTGSRVSGGAPQAAVIGIVATPKLELFFDTLATSRKCANLRRDPHIALVIGWDEEQTVQLEGKADEPRGAELERLRELYYARFPDGRTRATWPDITYFRVRPTWIRYSDFRGAEPRIVEVGPSEIERAGR